MYAKLIDNEIEFAPQNKGSIINYNTNIDLMVAEGYKLYVEAEKPVTNRMYHIEYDEKIDKIREIIVYDETQAEANTRETKEREEEFNNKFLATSKGNYRLQPRGYSNAQQSIDTVNGIVNALGALTEEIAEMVIFYPTPDFTKPEQCTEEWLIAHQYNIETMTKQAWSLYYLEFSRLYAQKQYKRALEDQS